MKWILLIALLVGVGLQVKQDMDLKNAQKVQAQVITGMAEYLGNLIAKEKLPKPDDVKMEASR